MKIYLATDHRGFRLAQEILPWLKDQNVTIISVGSEVLIPADDYADYAKEVARFVADGKSGEEELRGILICGSGVGMDITANRTRGIRSGLGISEEQIRAARADDNINILTIAADYTTVDVARKMIYAFLTTPFKTEQKYSRRIGKIDNDGELGQK